MEKSNLKSNLGIALVLGSVWGLSEVALGAGLHACARMASGSMMTGVALFFIAATWVATKNFHMPVLVVLIACLFKLFDAVLLSLPVLHGAIGNPIFAFLMEGLAFLVLIALFRKQNWQKRSSKALLGGGAALIAVALFPLVKFATGVPACVYPGTAVPLSIFFAPIALALSAITVPLGFAAGDKIRSIGENADLRIRRGLLRYTLSPLTLIICLVLVTLFRWIVTSDLS